MKKIVYALVILICLQACKSQNEQESTEGISPKISAQLLTEANLYSGKLFRIDSFPSNHIVPRAVDIWLPSNYDSTKKFAVLYMHDGQNLFDSTTTWNQQEWKVDEWASQLMNDNKTKNFIVVGIHNIPKIRWQDLYPQKALDYMPKNIRDSIFEMASSQGINIKLQGDDYLKFLVEEVKPHIDQNYSVLTDRDNTFVAGSSMGGLMSMYAISEYPDVFGGAACLSTHWPGVMPSENNPHPEAIFKYMEANLPSHKNHKLYFDYGTKTLDQYYPQYASRVDSILIAKGYNEATFKNLKFEGTDHSENSWNKRLNVPLTFLLGN